MFTCLPRVGTTNGDVLVNDMPCGGQTSNTHFRKLLIHVQY